MRSYGPRPMESLGEIDTDFSSALGMGPQDFFDVTGLIFHSQYTSIILTSPFNDGFS
ncbi:hypothetical protein K438DRAFT_1868549 [Mycena galopus ATCC 62051]|nr:hypothetical protein K438DRAFT_1868549 [Mycena galopus ATCC 62051]